ncbi:MAG: rod shape-determining protein MreC, partial [bacterium]
MLRFLQERRNAALLSALFVISFTLMTLSVRRHGGTTLIERSALTLSGPLMEASAAPKRWIQNLWRRYILLQDMRAENLGLRKEIASLQALSLKVRELQTKVGRLEGLLGGRRNPAAPVRLARIVGRNLGALSHTVIVDLGAADGVRRNMPVLHEAGLVGRISRVGRGVSQVLLLTDYRSAVDVLVQRSRASGVFSISSRGVGELRYMADGGKVEASDLLISSGLGGIFPKGLPVAQVTKIGPKGERLFQQVEAEPIVDFG